MKELRPYQKDSIHSLRQGFIDGHKRQVLAASTGAGKSIIAIELIRNVLEKEKRVMFLCDRRVLVGQFSQHLYSEKIPHGVIMAGNSMRMCEKVQIASVQTLEKMDGWPRVDLVIVDEIHAVMRKSLKAMMDAMPDLKVIGLTATPYHAELKNYFSSVTNVITMGDLVEQGYLVPFRVFAATEIDTKGVKVVGSEWQKDELEKRGLQIVGDVVSDYLKITDTVFEGRPRKTICFSAGVAHGAELVKKFAEHGLNFVQISYLDDEEYKADVLREFAKPDTGILGVISTDILTRGFDQPDVEHVILAKPLRKSFSQHVQMVGRGARTFAGKGFCVLQDNSGNWLRFSDSFGELYHDGVKTLDNDADVKKRKEPTEKEKAQSKCPQCRTIWPTIKTDICPSCGFLRQRKNKVEAVAGVTSEIDAIAKKEKKEKFSADYKRDFYAQLRQYAIGKGYADGWAYHKYKAKFGVYPSMAKPEPTAVGFDVYDFVTSQNIRYAKRRA